MPRITRANLYLGVICVAGAMATALLWVPFDTETGLIETVRRRTSIGDALAPTIAAAFVGLGGLLLLAAGRDGEAGLTRANLQFSVALVSFLALAILVMRWVGPLAVEMFGPDGGYRPLRDTAPWKWIGFAAGGFIMITGLIVAIERRLTLRAVLVGLFVTAALIAMFDLPFEDLLLPPNGDV